MKTFLKEKSLQALITKLRARNSYVNYLVLYQLLSPTREEMEHVRSRLDTKLRQIADSSIDLVDYFRRHDTYQSGTLDLHQFRKVFSNDLEGLANDDEITLLAHFCANDFGEIDYNKLKC